jgi:hypothetical protein
MSRGKGEEGIFHAVPKQENLKAKLLKELFTIINNLSSKVKK